MCVISLFSKADRSVKRFCPLWNFPCCRYNPRPLFPFSPNLFVGPFTEISLSLAPSSSSSWCSFFIINYSHFKFSLLPYSRSLFPFTLEVVDTCSPSFSKISLQPRPRPASYPIPTIALACFDISQDKWISRCFCLKMRSCWCVPNILHRLT